ncbi:probable ATP-dependent RNA helicase DHX40 [Anneissia japonica]|uniref:probable ATP-dependent RNA helicase DHX40 n=1 Tax=Anneissia japonica TaxID=1529436 RepID=UPI00142597EA|nr:probable ATP-dependent RNA helicase DHX40 [Anneissia japonica]
MSASMIGRKLPIESFRNEIIRSFTKSRAIVIVGQTGSGKTTQLPQFLHECGFSKYGLIGVTQPRRVAAISVANRVADEMKCEVGEEVGYQVRFDDHTSDATRIKYMTDGCLLREFLDDRELRKYSVIVLDEAHERSLSTDILFGLVKQVFLTKNSVQSKRERPLKVVVMSATLDEGKFCHFLCDCPVLEIPGRVFPVQDIYCDLVKETDLKSNTTINYVKKVVDVVMQIHMEELLGDILVFLTGQAEIEHACDQLYEMSERIEYCHDVQDPNIEALLILPIYGSMPTDLQRRIFSPADRGVRKVVVATNIAGTSLTIDGIRYVVDSGFVKQLTYNPRTGLDALQVVPVSRSEAIQRTGRAGRTAPGKCYRIYSKGLFENCMSEDTVAEIQRSSLTSVVLNLKCMGVHDIINFPYLDAPEERMLLEALRELYYFGAIDKEGHITDLGHLIVDYPLPPFLARAVINSGAMGCQDIFLPIAAMLSVESVFIRPGDEKRQKEATEVHNELAAMTGGKNDFATLLAIFHQYSESNSRNRWCRKNYIHQRALKMAVSIHKQLQTIIEKQMKDKGFPRVADLKGSKGEFLRRVLCTGYFGKVARKAPTGKGFRTMEGHGTIVYIHPSSVLIGKEESLDWVIFHEVVWTSKVYMRTVCPIQYEWVRDLLPRLHELDAYSLSGCLAPTFDDGKKEDLCEVKLETSIPEINSVPKMSKRNNEDSVSEARLRYFERKRARAEKK